MSKLINVCTEMEAFEIPGRKTLYDHIRENAGSYFSLKPGKYRFRPRNGYSITVTGDDDLKNLIVTNVNEAKIANFQITSVEGIIPPTIAYEWVNNLSRLKKRREKPRSYKTEIFHPDGWNSCLSRPILSCDESVHDFIKKCPSLFLVMEKGVRYICTNTIRARYQTYEIVVTDPQRADANATIRLYAVRNKGSNIVSTEYDILIEGEKVTAIKQKPNNCQRLPMLPK